jgi:hypothetical protein
MVCPYYMQDGFGTQYRTSMPADWLVKEGFLGRN